MNDKDVHDGTSEKSEESANFNQLEKPSNSRWWEQYTVRYFIGTVVGVFVIFSLRSYADLHSEIAAVLPELGKVDVKQFTAVAALGLAFCYVASAPILTLHAVRGALSFSGTMVFCSLLGFLVVLALLVGASHWLPPSFVAWFGLVVVVLMQIALIGVASTASFRKLKGFYDRLIEARFLDWSRKRDYAESYRHLREHGNALAIVFMELALGVILAKMASREQFVVALAIWIIPGAWCWLLGSVLEKHFADGRPAN